jgi:hypothetical protein
MLYVVICDVSVVELCLSLRGVGIFGVEALRRVFTITSVRRRMGAVIPTKLRTLKCTIFF